MGHQDRFAMVGLGRVTRWAWLLAAGFAGCHLDPNPFPSGPRGEQPGFADITEAATPPPPLSGGTLISSRDGRSAIAADPDRDRVVIVDLEGRAVRAVVDLLAGDEPGRLAEDGVGRVHVALRRGGAVATIDLASGKLVDRRAVCAAPRGIAWDARGDHLHVACAGGELVTLPAAAGAATRTLLLERDLRDVIVEGDHLLVSRFRAAELLVVDRDGKARQRLAATPFATAEVRAQVPFAPSIAWRTVALPGGGAMMLHQRAFTGVVATTPAPGGEGGPGGGASYGSGFSRCDGAIVHATITRLGSNGSQLAPSTIVSAAVVPVDLALSPDGKRLAIAAAGNSRLPNQPGVLEVAVEQFGGALDDCLTPSGPAVSGQAVAVAYTPRGTLLVQTREPAAVQLDGYAIPIANDRRGSLGHAIFHANTGQQIACASCHPEGGEDGRVWRFDSSGLRRTQSLRGGILGTAPFHWDGDMSDLDAITKHVFHERMGGPALAGEQTARLEKWLDQVPLLPEAAARDGGAVARGRQLYQERGCATCHGSSGRPSATNEDVGTQGRFQIPQLRGVAARAPFMHDGCATTLADRFTNTRCGGAAHGDTRNLTPDQIQELVSFLETL